MTRRTTPREHGTKACYVFGEWGGDSRNGCRCADCRAAIARYEQKRNAATEPPYVSANQAREHITFLATQGVGLKQIAKVSGVSHGALWKLVYGVPSAGRAPSKRIRPATAQAILAVSPTDGADGSMVPADRTLENVDRLVAAGVPKARIAERCGQKGPGLQIGSQMVTRRTARAVEAMVAELDAGTLVTVRHGRHGITTIAPAAPEDEAATPPAYDDRDKVTLALVELLEERIDQNQWRREAACRGRPSWMFFPARGDVVTLAAAKKICSACFVRDDCLAANLNRRDGVYGGMSARERRALRGAAVAS